MVAQRANSAVTARDDILAGVRNAIADVPSEEPPDIPRRYSRSLGLGRGEILDLFAERVADYRATVHRVTGSGLGEAVASVLAGRGAERIAIPPDLRRDWLPDSVEVVVDEGHLTPSDLDRIDGAVTTAALGIAATGTLVLDGGDGQGRRMLSLVPDYHLCIVEAERVVGSVPEAVERLDPARPLTFVSGPSATSDIEFNRIEGVHGPRTLDVLLVE